MIMLNRFLIEQYAACVLFFLLAGCGLMPDRPAKWVHPTNAQAKIKSDHRECAIEAWKRYPKKEGMVKEADGYWDKGIYPTTTCQTNKYSDRTYCISDPGTPGKWVDARIVQGDENAIDRSKWYGGCMSTKDSQYKCVKGFTDLDGSMCGHYSE